MSWLLATMEAVSQAEGLKEFVRSPGSRTKHSFHNIVLISTAASWPSQSTVAVVEEVFSLS